MLRFMRQPTIFGVSILLSWNGIKGVVLSYLGLLESGLLERLSGQICERKLLPF